MYGIVMMMALNGAPDAPALGHKHGGGCCGCMGSSCYGGGCNGCYGGGRHHGHRHHGGGGCCGCMGSSCYGGCYGYSSGCGCCGATTACGGGCDACGGYGAPMGGYGAPMGGEAPKMMPPPTGEKKGTPPPPPTAALAAPATIVVSLPADAALSFEGVATKSTSAVRQFTTPALEVGQAYHYTLTAQVVRDGKPVTATEEVTVRAGETTRVELAPAVPAVAVALK